MVLGRLGDAAILSGAGLAIITMNVTKIGLGIGLSGGIETLSSQAFGSKNNYLAGCYFTRGQVLVTIACIPFFFFLWNGEGILKFIGQPEDASEYAGVFIRYYIFGSFMGKHNFIHI